MLVWTENIFKTELFENDNVTIIIISLPEFSSSTGCFPLCRRFRKFRSEFKWKGPFRFLPTRIFGITSAGSPLAYFGRNIPTEFRRCIFNKPVFAQIREFGKGIKHGKSYSNRPFTSSLVPQFQNESKVRNRSNENEFDFHENEPVGGTHFHMNGFALKLVLTRRRKGTRKWPV